MNLIDEIVKEVFNEASKGIVKIESNGGDWKFYTRFYSKIEGKSDAHTSTYPIVEIPNYTLFLKYISDYLNKAYDFYLQDKKYLELEDRAYLKKLFLDLIINASSYDFIDIFSYVKRKEKQLNDKTIREGNFVIGKYQDLDIICNISRNHSNLEGPYQIKFAFVSKDKNDFFELPQITFAIADNKGYIMCIQNKNKNRSDLCKKLDRYFRKVNKDVEDASYLKDVNINGLISLTIFNAYLKQLNIKEVIANNYLPVRYHANKVAIYNKNKNNKENQDEAILKHNYIQSNITDKFTNLFLRYQYHFDGCEFNYDDFKQEIILKLNDGKYNNDNIIYEIEKAITEFNNSRLTR